MKIKRIEHVDIAMKSIQTMRDIFEDKRGCLSSNGVDQPTRDRS